MYGVCVLYTVTMYCIIVKYKCGLNYVQIKEGKMEDCFNLFKKNNRDNEIQS